MRPCLLLLFVACLAGCVGIPEGVQPVRGFELERYLGRWYEIARLDHRFERGLTDITATYSRRPEGGVEVVNRGYNAQQGKWETAHGRAYFVGDSDVAHLKVSFFGPFYGSYVVFELDREGYEHAFVTGPNRDYLWLLARSPTVDPAVLARFQRTAAELGFDTGALIFPSHTRAGPTPAAESAR